MTNLLRRLGKVEELMNPPGELKFQIEVVFISPAGEDTGTRTFSSNTSEDQTDSQLRRAL
jgi:hypothetical protein